MKLIAFLALIVGAISAANGGALDVQKIVLQGDSGLYLSRFTRHGVNRIEVVKPTPDQFCVFDVIENSDGSYSFKADSGKYLSRYTRHGVNNIEAVKDSIDIYSKFKVTSLGNGQITVQADSGLYWSRYTRYGINGVEAVKYTPDLYSRFTVTRVDVVGAKFLKSH